METILSNLESVLCDPEGKCCITGSAADRAIVDDALDALRATIAQPVQPAEELLRKMTVMVKWLETNQPDVFRRGLWDAIAQPTD